MSWLLDVTTWALQALELWVLRPGRSVPVDPLPATLVLSRAISADTSPTGGLDPADGWARAGWTRDGTPTDLADVAQPPSAIDTARRSDRDGWSV
jgi:hypothetical protein